MTDVVYLDTNVLPQRGPLRGGFMSPLTALAAHDVFKIVVPDLVVTEYRNLRLDRARQAIDRLVLAIKHAGDHLQLPGIYIPSPDEVVDPLIDEIKGLTELVETDPEDAAVALEREALRVRPARNGVGARDAAIWLTIVRHHKDSGLNAVFVTKNTDDFAAKKGSADAHPQLIEDLGVSEGRMRFVFSPFDFLEEIAPKAEAPDIAGLIADGNIADQVGRAVAIYLDLESAGEDAEPGDDATMEIHEVHALAAHQVDASVLVKVGLQGEIEAGGEPPRAMNARVWIEFGTEAVRLLDLEQAQLL